MRREIHMDFGMPTLIENKDLGENIALCKELDLQFVELNMNFPMYQIPQLEETAHLKKLARDNGIYFTIHLDENLNVCDFNPLVAEAYMETTERALKAAVALGAPLLNMHMNHGIYVTLPDRKVRLFGEYREPYMAAIHRFREMCERTAGDSGVKVCIENTDGYQEFEKEAIDYLLESAMFALTWDIGHSHACGNVDEDFLCSAEAGCIISISTMRKEPGIIRRLDPGRSIWHSGSAWQRRTAAGAWWRQKRSRRCGSL